jgi:hypothetical protein
MVLLVLMSWLVTLFTDVCVDVKKHKWFDSKINFALIRNMTPPMKPVIAHPTDTSNFRSIIDDETDDGEDEELEDENDPTNPFREFTTSNDSIHVLHTFTDFTLLQFRDLKRSPNCSIHFIYFSLSN